MQWVSISVSLPFSPSKLTYPVSCSKVTLLEEVPGSPKDDIKWQCVLAVRDSFKMPLLQWGSCAQVRPESDNSLGRLAAFQDGR